MGVCTNAKAKYSSSVVPTDPSVHFYHCDIRDAVLPCAQKITCKKGKGSPYSITKRRVSELIPVLGSQYACDVSHKPGGRLPLLSARPAVTPATLKRAATHFAAW